MAAAGYREDGFLCASIICCCTIVIPVLGGLIQQTFYLTAHNLAVQAELGVWHSGSAFWEQRS